MVPTYTVPGLFLIHLNFPKKIPEKFFIHCSLKQCSFWQSAYYIITVKSAKESPSTKTKPIPLLMHIGYNEFRI